MTDQPSPPDEVIPGLYISGLITARACLSSIPPKGFPNITHVLSIHNGRRRLEQELTVPRNCRVQHKTINIDDTADTNIIQYFPEICAFIKEALLLPDNQVLVHCKAGISRSASAIIAYLFFARQIPVREGLIFLRAKRGIVNPNRGFRAQLSLWQHVGCELLDAQDFEKKGYVNLKRRWRLESAEKWPDLLFN